ncbi:hypothetical protein [Bradyrhizobium embrapense]|nr:hypothetical protein [Bradyrhizobium embrapense]
MIKLDPVGRSKIKVGTASSNASTAREQLAQMVFRCRFGEPPR